MEHFQQSMLILLSYTIKFISEKSVSRDGEERSSRMSYEFEILLNPFRFILFYFLPLTFFLIFNLPCESFQPSIMDTVLQPSVPYGLSNNKIKLVKKDEV